MSTLGLKGDGDGDLTIDAGNGTVTFTGAVTIGKDDLTIADSAIAVVTAGIGGSTGSVTSTTTPARTLMERLR